MDTETQCQLLGTPVVAAPLSFSLFNHHFVVLAANPSLQLSSSIRKIRNDSSSHPEPGLKQSVLPDSHTVPVHSFL